MMQLLDALARDESERPLSDVVHRDKIPRRRIELEPSAPCSLLDARARLHESLFMICAFDEDDREYLTVAYLRGDVTDQSHCLKLSRML